MDKTIFAVTSTGIIHTSTFFIKKEDAVADLKRIAKDRKNKPGVTVEEDTDTKFSFRIGWEEHKVTFSILEVPIK